MLYHKRIDVAIFGKLFIKYSNKLGYPRPNYLKETPLTVDQISLVCHKNAKTEAYMESINPHVLKLVKRF